MRFVIIVLVGVLVFHISGCNIINPVEKVPTFVKVDSFVVTPSGNDSFGSSAQNVTAFTAYYNNTALGTYDVPATVPFFPTGGGGTLSFQPVINMSGLETYLAYPFFNFDSKTIPADSIGKTIHYTPHTRYKNTAKMVFYTNFESGIWDNNFILSEGDTNIVKTQDPNFVFEGKSAGLIYLKGTQKTSSVISTRYFKLTQGVDAFLEMNYKCSVPFWVGIYSSNTNLSKSYVYNVKVGVKDSWNKMYVNLNANIDLNNYFITGTNINYYVVFYTYTASDETGGWVAIDNIKVITP